ncbi:MAG TPA: site-specific integrase [Gammaproteobacteria bacterium]|nr:site-specific integrase [Gammaproteobacteria bacterium]
MATYIKRKTGWVVRVRRKGQKPVAKTFKKKLDAERWAASIETQIHTGSYVSTQAAERTTLADMLDRYQRDITAKKSASSVKTEEYRIAMFKDALGYLTMVAVTPMVIVDHVDERLTAVASDTVKRELTLLADVFTTAQALWGINLNVNPVHAATPILRKTRRIGANNERDRRLEPWEQEALASVEHDRPTVIAELIEFDLHTTMRRGELAAMQRPNINWKDATLTIPASKTDWKTGQQGRVIPLSPRAMEILRDLPVRVKTLADGSTVVDNSVWGYEDAHSITQAFARTIQIWNRGENEKKKQEPGYKPRLIDDLRFHDLRHEAISRLFEDGWSIQEVAVFSGHKDWKSLKKYTHIKPKRIARELARRVAAVA